MGRASNVVFRTWDAGAGGVERRVANGGYIIGGCMAARRMMGEKAVSIMERSCSEAL